MTHSLPVGWAETTFADLGRWCGGGTPSKSKAEYWTNGTIPWVSPKDMKTLCIANAEDEITEKALAASATNLIPADSVLMVTRSGILARTLPVAKNVVPVAINQDLKALTPWKGVNPDFVLAMLRWLESPILHRCAKSGTTVSNINFPEFLKYSVPLPPLNEQRRIVAKIEALMTRSARAKEALDAIPALLDRYRQSVLAAAFRGDLTADWRAHNLGTSANISECWKLSVVSNVAELVSGQTPKGVAEQLSAEGEVPWFKVADMNHAANQREMVEFNSFLTKAQAKQLGLKIRPQGTVIFPKRGGAIATNKKRVLGCPAAFDLNIMGLIPKAVTSEFLWCWLLTVDLSKISDGSNVPQINNGDIAPLPIRVPSEEEQHEICRLLADVFASIETVEGAWKAASGHLPKLNQSVLAKAFRGELVPQDPNDEPASELLARIKAGRTATGTPSRRGGRRKRAAAPVA